VLLLLLLLLLAAGQLAQRRVFQNQPKLTVLV
jgi:hypothetical protein